MVVLECMKKHAVEKLVFSSSCTVYGEPKDLKEVDEQGESILDTTSVLLTSNLGNASSHSNKNMPVLPRCHICNANVEIF